jgi:hypothetical protein
MALARAIPAAIASRRCATTASTFG